MKKNYQAGTKGCAVMATAKCEGNPIHQVSATSPQWSLGAMLEHWAQYCKDQGSCLDQLECGKHVEKSSTCTLFCHICHMLDVKMSCILPSTVANIHVFYCSDRWACTLVLFSTCSQTNFLNDNKYLRCNNWISNWIKWMPILISR